MNMSELAARMLEWEDTQRKADALRSEIEAAVLKIGKTQSEPSVSFERVGEDGAA